MSSDDIRRLTPDTTYMVDYVKIRPFFNSAYVIRGRDDVRTAKIPDVVISISDAAKTAFADLTVQQANEISRFRNSDPAAQQVQNAKPGPEMPNTAPKEDRG